MRILPATLALSAALHTGAIAWVRAHDHVQAPAPRAVSPPIEIVNVESPPMAVALLDDHSVSTRAGVTSSAGPEATARGRARISTGHATPTPTADAPEGATPPHSTLMDMRRPEVTRGISEDFVSTFLEHSKPLVPSAIEGQRIHDDIARDEQHLHDPRWIANATPDEVSAARLGLEAHRGEAAAHELRPDGTGTKAIHQTFVAHVEADGSAHLRDEPNLQRHGLGATFDVTDAVMRHFGDDPYASNKRKFLDQTREERYQIGAEYKHRQLAQSAQLVASNIDRMWATTATLADRKTALFELWDECAETGADDAVEGGRAARKIVIGAIRSRLTGADAYSADEVARYNAHRTSRATFAPYED